MRYWRVRPLSEAERAGWFGNPRNPFNQPRRGFFIPPGLRRPTQPDPWVQEEFEVETGRVVHQETIEGEPQTLNPGAPLRDDLA